MRKIAVVLLSLLIIQFQFATRVQAAPGGWTCTFDFAGQLAGWSISNNTGGATPFGVGEVDGIRHNDARSPVSSGSYFRRADINHTISSTTINHIGITFDYTVGSFDGSPTQVWAIQINGSTVVDRDSTYVSSMSGSNVVDEWEGSTEATSIRILIASSIRSTATYSGAVKLKEAVVSGDGINPFTEGTGIACDETELFTKPIAAPDVDNEWSDIETYAAGLTFLQQRTLFQYSATPGAYVQAPTDGTVESIRSVTLGDCASYLQSPVALAVPLVCGLSVHGYGYWLPGSFTQPKVDVVTIVADVGNTSFVYFVANARDYIEEGMTVSPGCWIGETFKLETLEISLSSGGASGSAADLGKGAVIFAVMEDAAVIDGADLFVVEQVGTAPCNQPEGYEECLGDAPLNIQNQWSVDKGIWDDPGVTLQPSGYIRTTMNLLPIMEPQMKVRAQALGGSSELTLQLGQTVDSSPVTVISSEVGIAPDEHLADFGDLHTVQVKNTGNFSVKITYICVQLTKDESGVELDPPPEGPPDTPNGGGDDIEGIGGPYAENCETISTPEGDDFGEWTTWLWRRFNNFHQCELMILLNAIYSFLQNSYRTFAWSIRWSQAVISDGVGRFSWEFVYWLGGHLSNIALGQVTTIYTAPEQCNNLFCLIDSIFDLFSQQMDGVLDFINTLIDPESPFWGILRDIVDTVLDILRQIFDLIISVLYTVVNVLLGLLNLIITIFLGFIGKIFELLGLGLALFQAIASAWTNATPTPLPGIPDCAADPQTHFLCKAIWIVDNTILSGTGFFAIVVIIGVASVHLLLWVVQQYRKAVLDLAEKI